MVKNKLVYDLVLLEADRIMAHRMKDLDLYYKDKNGGYEPIAEAYNDEVLGVLQQLMKSRKMRYFISFVDAMDLQDEIRPSAHKVLRFMAKNMSYGNVLKDYGIRDIQVATGINTNYVMKGIAELCGKDMIRFTIDKGRRTYMVNPIYYYKGTMKKLFYAIKQYDKYPVRNEDLEEQYKSDNIFN